MLLLENFSRSLVDSNSAMYLKVLQVSRVFGVRIGLLQLQKHVYGVLSFLLTTRTHEQTFNVNYCLSRIFYGCHGYK